MFKEGIRIKKRRSVIFICTHNSARSQMAEGYLNARYGDLYKAYSAGTEKSWVSDYAIAVMAEKGIDISGAKSQALDEYVGADLDIAVTVCDSAHAVCPMFPWSKKTIHASFEDPSAFSGSEEEILSGFRNLRNEIFTWIDDCFG